MTLILQLIALTSIWVLGLKIVTADGMILRPLGVYAEEKAKGGSRIFEALIFCEWCMPSIHSLAGYGFAIAIGLVTHFEWRLVYQYPIIVMGASLVSGLVWTIFQTLVSLKQKIDTEHTYLSHIEQMAYWDCAERKKKHSFSNNNTQPIHNGKKQDIRKEQR